MLSQPINAALPDGHRLKRRPLGEVLYPDLFHRRACAVMAAAARRKREDAGAANSDALVTDRSPLHRRNDGRSAECA